MSNLSDLTDAALIVQWRADNTEANFTADDFQVRHLQGPPQDDRGNEPPRETLVASDAAEMGTTASNIVTGGTYTLNEHAGEILRMLTGDEAGEESVIGANTTTDFPLVTALTGAPSASETFTIESRERPAYIIEGPNFQMFARTQADADAHVASLLA